MDKNDDIQEQAKAYANMWLDLVSMWSDFASEVATTGLSFSPDATPFDAARQVRDEILKVTERFAVRYMRSPQFLEAMKAGTDASIAARKKVNDALVRAHHEMQSPAREDVDHIMLSIRHLETRVLDRISRLESRLEDIADKVEALDGDADSHARTRGNGGKASGASKKTKK